MLLTESALYVAFECTDPDPSRITIHTMTRDAEQEGDDTVSLVLDTFGDRRTGYLFQVNAAGARLDGLISGPEHPSLDWNGIWDARIVRTPQGWSAELEIPTRTLSFTQGQTSGGINLERNIARDRTVLRAFSPSLDSCSPDLSRAGRIEGVEVLKQGKGLETSPLIAGRSAKDFTVPSHNWKGQPGIDVTWRVTPQMAAVFTVNTDFAETEVDSRKLNLTRFSLFFPERRSYFLEGSNQFEFGLGLGESFIPFFSRRIGLYDGQLIPIDAGVKLNGRAGRWNIGLLSVKTRNIRGVPRTSLFAGRIRTDIDERLELMAQEHYMCFLSLSIARGGLDDEAHPERTFSSLQNAGNRAHQVINLFNDIRAACLPANPDPIDPTPLADYCRGTATTSMRTLWGCS